MARSLAKALAPARLAGLAACAALLACSAAHAQAPRASFYKWIGPDGSIHYGDHIPANASKDQSESVYANGHKNVSPRQQTPEELAAAQQAKAAQDAAQSAVQTRRVAGDKLYLTFPRFDQLQSYEHDQIDRREQAIHSLAAQQAAAKAPADKQRIGVNLADAERELEQQRLVQADERQMWLEAQSRARSGQTPDQASGTSALAAP
jgi:hypothetical protein